MKFKHTPLLIVLVLFNSLYAWDNIETHPAITEDSIEKSDIDNYLKTQMDLIEGIAKQLYWDFPQDIETRIDRGNANPNQTTRTISQWLRVGSLIEDEDGRRIAPWRPRHHFHDPTRNAGLDNHTDHPDWEAPFFSSWLPLGQSALIWAIDGVASKEPQINNEKWADARAMFYESLISPDKSTRESRLAETFLKLGCVIHLLEDMGVPAHTRNDFLFGHYRSIYKWDWDNPLETWVEERIEANSGQCPWSGSGPVVFDKLSKYFDTNIYNGSYLGDGQVPPGAWGLSECTNYQFLSLSTVFDCFGSLYQFPHPAKEHTSLLFSSVPDGFKVYFDGSNYGVTHLARDSYTRYVGGRYGFSGPSIDSTITTDDLNVFEDYAEITIPRTINYASGLINYFFRGRLSVEPNCLDGNDVQLIITNESSNSGVQQTLKGGTFELYWDDEDGERNEVTDFTVDGWGPSSTLGYGQSVTGQFACPEYEAEEYTLVYKGAISENPADSDPDDLDTIAICKVETPENCCIVDCSPPGSFTLSFSDIMECSEQCECFEGGYEVWPSNLNSQNIICPYRYETKGFNFFTGWANGWSFNITTPYYPPYCNKRIWVSVSYEDVCYTDEAFGVCLAFGGYIEDFSQSQQANNRLLEGDCCSFNDDWFTFGNEEGDALVTGYGGTCTLICNP